MSFVTLRRNCLVEWLWLISLCHIVASPLALASLTSALLTRFERTPLNNRDDIAGFIALGGGEERIREAARLARSHPGAKLVITGQGDGAVRLGRQSGLNPEHVLIEPAAQNTFENAQFTARLLGSQASAHWVLVTSASHMARAIGCFRKAAIHIEPWPIADISTGWRDTLSTATHEWLGMLAYWLAGRTDALFPAPYDHNSRQVLAAARQLVLVTN